jgi:hypothetical protein
MGKHHKQMRVVVLTRNYQIHGTITMDREARLTDHVIKADGFMAVTDAEVTRPDGGEVLAASFLDINRESIEIVVPDEPNNLIRKRDVPHLIGNSGPDPIAIDEPAVEGDEKLTFDKD